MFNLKEWCLKNGVDYEHYFENRYWAEGGYGRVDYEVVNFKGNEHLINEVSFLRPDRIICGNIWMFID